MDDGPDPNAWLVTFGDLITLLLTFFVLMLSMSSVDKKRIEESFSYFAGKPFVLEGGESSYLGPPAEEQGSPAQQIERGMRIARVMQGLLTPESEGKVSASEKILDGKGEVRVKADARGQVIVFSGSFLFTPGSATLKVNAFPVLNTVAKILRDTADNITVEGHTDDRELPLDPRYRDRWDLSAARAIHVLKYLNEEGKIPGTRLAAVGYGDTRPLAEVGGPGSFTAPIEKEAMRQERIRAENRRVEIIIARESK